MKQRSRRSRSVPSPPTGRALVHTVAARCALLVSIVAVGANLYLGVTMPPDFVSLLNGFFGPKGRLAAQCIFGIATVFGVPVVIYLVLYALFTGLRLWIGAIAAILDALGRRLP